MGGGGVGRVGGQFMLVFAPLLGWAPLWMSFWWEPGWGAQRSLRLQLLIEARSASLRFWGAQCSLPLRGGSRCRSLTRNVLQHTTSNADACSTFAPPTSSWHLLWLLTKPRCLGRHASAGQRTPSKDCRWLVNFSQSLLSVNVFLALAL